MKTSCFSLRMSLFFLPAVSNYFSEDPLLLYWGQVEHSETSEIFFQLFLFRLVDFDPILKIENSEEENPGKKFRGFQRFRRFQVFDLPLFRFFNRVSQIQVLVQIDWVFSSFVSSIVFISYFAGICYSRLLWAVIIQHANTCSKSHE